VGHAKRLTAPEGDVGNLRINDSVRQLYGLRARQLVRPGSIGTGVFAARQASCTTAIG